MDPLLPLINALHGEGRLRVWSLVITAFGDLFQHRGGEVSSARLGLLMGRVGVEPGTVRTAMSRLVRDGWVERERLGRVSRFRLSASGQNRFAPATSRIYAAPEPEQDKDWALWWGGAGQTPRLCAASQIPPEAEVAVTGALTRCTDGFRAGLLGDTHAAALRALARDLDALSVDVPEPLDAAAARMLLIHRWRRIVLRHPFIPARLMPRDAPLPAPRVAVAARYAALGDAAEAWLSAPAGGDAALPPPSAAFAARFRMPTT